MGGLARLYPARVASDTPKIIWFLLVIHCLLHTLQDKSFYFSLDSLPSSSYLQTLSYLTHRQFGYQSNTFSTLFLCCCSIPLCQLLDYKALPLRCSWESLLMSCKGLSQLHSLVLQRDFRPTVDFLCWHTHIIRIPLVYISAFCYNSNTHYISSLSSNIWARITHGNSALIAPPQGKQLQHLLIYNSVIGFF